MNKSSSTGKICGGILGAAVIAGFSGFILGLIFAPQSGKNLRRSLAKKFIELIDRSKFAMIEAKVMAEEFIEKSREQDTED